jgi:hypothetical protein
MRCLGALHVAAATDIPADITRRQTLRPKNANHDVSKILANTTAVSQDFDKGEIDGSGERLILELVMNAMRKVQHHVNQGTICVEIVPAYAATSGNRECMETRR